MYDLPHESQGNYPVCTAMSVTRVFEWLVKKETGEDVQFSVKQVYTESGGSQSGISTTHVIKTLIKRGAIEDKYNKFDPDEPKADNWPDLWSLEAEMNRFQPRWKLGERITVTNKVKDEEDRKKVHKALEEHGPLIVTVNATDGWYRGQMPSGKKWKRLHAIALVGYEDGHWIGLNSWNELSDNGSLVKIHNDYPFAFVYALKGVISPHKDEKTICQ